MNFLIRFRGGPAAGVHLAFRRHPIYLRVVRAGATWDALDQPEDVARMGESIHAYRRVGPVDRGMIDFDGKDKHKSGPCRLAEYRYIDDQPPDAVLRDNARWAEWATAQHAAAKGATTPDA